MKTFSIILLITAILFTQAADNSSIFPEDDWHSDFIGINDKGDDLFYILFRSRGEASADPLVFWLTGGPGCSSEIALFFENGPYHINQDLSLTSNPYSWNTKANLVFIDQPIGTGYSRAASVADFDRDEDAIAQAFLTFLVGFFEKHPDLKGRDLYLTGESYAGHYIPAMSALIHKTNNTDINLKGLAIGNGWVDPYYQYPAYNKFAYENNLISYPTSLALAAAFKACQGLIITGLWPVALEECQLSVTGILGLPFAPRFNVYDIREKCEHPPLCYDFSIADKFLSQDKVVAALNTSGRSWSECNMEVHTMMLGDWIVDLTFDVSYLVESGLKVLVYSGNKDFICNWRGGEAWTNQVKWSKASQFQTANYTQYVDSNGTVIGDYKQVDNFSFLKVHDAGHMVPLDQPANALTMLNDFIAPSSKLSFVHA